MTCRCRVGSWVMARWVGTKLTFPSLPLCTSLLSDSLTLEPSFLPPQKWNRTSPLNLKVLFMISILRQLLVCYYRIIVITYRVWNKVIPHNVFKPRYKQTNTDKIKRHSVFIYFTRVLNRTLGGSKEGQPLRHLEKSRWERGSSSWYSWRTWLGAKMNGLFLILYAPVRERQELGQVSQALLFWLPVSKSQDLRHKSYKENYIKWFKGVK